MIRRARVAMLAEDHDAWNWGHGPRPAWWFAMYPLSVAADRRDAELMYLRERAKASTTEAWEDWKTHRREWFPSGWGLA